MVSHFGFNIFHVGPETKALEGTGLAHSSGVTLLQVLLEQATFLVGGVGFLLGGASYVVESKGRSSLQGMSRQE